MHCILQLLEHGYRVRGTLRTLSREPRLRITLAEHVNAAGDRLEFVQADLLQDSGWPEAVQGCDFVLHVASPFPLKPPQHEDDLVLPARDGTLRVLRAAARGGVKRVVLTSSTAAIIEGHGHVDKTFNEDDWSNLNGKISAYAKSKTLAERAAWDFVTQTGKDPRLELAVINPPSVYGPLLDGEFRTSVELIRKLIRREVPGVARVMIPFVDVRDVAAAHLAVMITPAAAGKRFCCVGSICSIREIALILDGHFASRGYRIPTRELPDFLVRFIAMFDGSVRLILDYLNKPLAISNERIKSVLGWQPRSSEEAVISMAESMIKYKII
jgi:nucleoside-diphosphate-sugar epimerase